MTDDGNAPDPGDRDPGNDDRKEPPPKRGSRGRPPKLTSIKGGKDEPGDPFGDDKTGDKPEPQEPPEYRWPGGKNKTGLPIANYLNARAALLRLPRPLYSFNLFRARYMLEIDGERTPANDHLFNDVYDELNLPGFSTSSPRS
jgi:hypothetical protein